MIGFLFVGSLRRRSGAETGNVTGALELPVLGMSFGRAVWKIVLHGILAMVPDGSGKGFFSLSPLLHFECPVLFCNQEMQTPASKYQFLVLWVRNVRPIGYANSSTDKLSAGEALD